MKNWISKITAVLHNRKGETLTESLVSIVLLSILFLAVATMIFTSLNLTKGSTRDAMERQNATNLGILAVGGTNNTLTLSTDGGVSVGVAVIQTKNDGLLAFSPKE